LVIIIIPVIPFLRPATLFLTPDLKPFFGGTYFPPDDRWGRPGLKTVLLGVADAWKNRRQELLKTGESLIQALQAQAARTSANILLTESVLNQAYRQFVATYDDHHGGFGSEPKFPMGHGLSFLLRIWKRTGDPQALKMVKQTLESMAAGGMYDQLGGGFHRYSTDPAWRVPHFEKMLYDQALLAQAYLEAYQATRDEAYASLAREIFEYLLRDMTSPEGAFTCAEDADSVEDAAHPQEKKEGAFYVWTSNQLQELLGAEKAKLIAYLYGVEPGGNALSDPQGEFQGKNILYRAHTWKEAAQKFKQSESQVQQWIAESKQVLLEARNKRPRPHRDDKILTDWNGLTIASLAFGSRVLEEPRYQEAALGASHFILEKLVREDGRLLHRYREGESGILGNLEDYAFFIQGLLDLYEATFESPVLEKAKRLTTEMVRLFWDEKGGGFFMIGFDAQRLLVRQKELYDGAIPSGNSVAASVLLRVGRLTMEKSFEEKAQTLFKGFSEEISQHPSAYPQLLQAFDFALGPSYEIVIAGASADPVTQEMIRAVYQRFLPNKVVALHPPGKEGAAIEILIPFLKEQKALHGKPTAYVCQNYACDLPITDLEELRRNLTKTVKVSHE